MKLKLITKVFTLCNKPEKLRERVFLSLSSCSFAFTWWTFVTFRNHIIVYFLALFWCPLWPSTLGAGTDQAVLFQITAGTAPSRNRTFGSGRFGLSRFALGRCGHGTFRSGHFDLGTFRSRHLCA